MTVSEWLENDNLFRKYLQEGWATEVYAEKRLRDSGVDVRRDDEERDITKHDHNKRAQYRNQADLILRGRDYLEVKGRNLEFTDDPKTFPYTTAIVMSVHSWDGHDPKRIMVIYVSNMTGGILGIPCNKENWTVDTPNDTKRGLNDDPAFYCQRSDMISFQDVVRRLG